MRECVYLYIYMYVCVCVCVQPKLVNSQLSRAKGWIHTPDIEIKDRAHYKLFYNCQTKLPTFDFAFGTGGGTVAEQSPRHLKVKGSSLAGVWHHERDKKVFKIDRVLFSRNSDHKTLTKLALLPLQRN